MKPYTVCVAEKRRSALFLRGEWQTVVASTDSVNTVCVVELHFPAVRCAFTGAMRDGGDHPPVAYLRRAFGRLRTGRRLPA